ncbi:MAG: 2-hydroxyacid dehydrogenase [Oscillatoriales cyanobacterium C42_A2020_001]|nr:2-hydroxyacid dehydrogenase [Leptolyngbyaceae cyanobacterium C42_A2020_001]
MKVAVFNTKQYDRRFLSAANAEHGHELIFYEAHLEPNTASLASGCPAVCLFVNDHASAKTLETLAAGGTQLIALRCTGYNNVDLEAAASLGMQVVRVTDYSPYSVAEHAVGLVMMLNRRLYKAYNRVRDDNFSLNGLMGFDLHGKTVGVIGTGKIGQCFAQIMKGFGCQLLGYDVQPNPACLELGMRYADLSNVLAIADVVSLHCPLLPSTYHLINATTIQQMKPGVMVINTSRGGLVDTRAVIEGIKSGQIGFLGIDVYEEEAELFFEDLSDTVIQDDVFQLLQSFSNVVITAHQAFFTQEAVGTIAETTLNSITEFEQGRSLTNAIALPARIPANA